MMIRKNKGFILEYKSADGCLLPIFLEQIFLPNKNVTVIDRTDNKREMRMVESPSNKLDHKDPRQLKNFQFVA